RRGWRRRCDLGLGPRVARARQQADADDGNQELEHDAISFEALASPFGSVRSAALRLSRRLISSIVNTPAMQLGMFWPVTGQQKRWHSALEPMGQPQVRVAVGGIVEQAAKLGLPAVYP